MSDLLAEPAAASGVSVRDGAFYQSPETNPESLPLLHLRTLGAVYLTRDDGAPLGGAASQRRLLALFAILASAGDAGVSRERIVSLLWPDGDSEKGRSSLSQALYSARKAVGTDDIFVTAGDNVRLDPDRVTSDIRELEQATAAGDLERAAAAYNGAFLDDFHIPGNVDFDRWAESQRSRINESINRTFDRLATAATGARDWPAAIDWRRRQLSIDPLNSPAARLHVEALLQSGDRVGALQQARLHVALVRAELEIEPDAEWVELIARMQQAPWVTPSAPVEPVAVSEIAPPLSAPVKDATRRPWLSFAGATIAASLILAFALMAALMPRPPRLDQQIIVAPFRTTGAGPSLSFLREGLVELISARIGDDDARLVDAGAVLRAWRHSKVLSSADAPQSEILSFANRLGARRVVVGSVVGDVGHLVITTSLVGVGDGRTHATASVEGPLDSLTSLVDRVTGKLLLDDAGEGERISDRMTPSLSALRAYLAGQAAYRQGSYVSALREYEKALKADSTFALAALHLALAADRLNAWEQHEHALSVAWANRAELAEADRLHLIAFAGPRYPSPSTEAEQLAAWEAALARSPDRVEVLVELAERFDRAGQLLGVQDATQRAAALVSRALEIDPQEPAARNMQLLHAARSGSTRASLRRSPSIDGLHPSVQWRLAISSDDARLLTSIRNRFATLDDENLIAIARMSQFDGAGIEDGERALAIRASRATRAADQLDAILSQHSLALNRGRPDLALQLTERLDQSQPGSRSHLRLRVLDALYGGGDTAAAKSASAALGRIVDAAPLRSTGARAEQLADACVVAQWRLARRELASVPGIIRDLRQAGLPRTVISVGANPHTCAELLDASLAVSTRAPDMKARVARVDALMLGGPAAGDAGAYAHLIVAGLYERLGEPDRALAAIKRRAYMYGWPRYLATARREEERLASMVGGPIATAAAPRTDR